MQGHPYYYPSKGYPATIRTDAAEGEHFSHRHTLAGTKHGHGKNAPPPPYYHHVKAASVQFDQDHKFTNASQLQSKLSPRIPGMQPQPAVGDPSNMLFKRKSVQNSEAYDRPSHKKSKSSMQHKLQEFVADQYEAYDKPHYVSSAVKRLKQESMRPTSATSGMVTAERDFMTKDYPNAYSGVFAGSTYDYNKSETLDTSSQQKLFSFTPSTQTIEPQKDASYFKKQARAKHVRTKSDQLGRVVDASKYALKNNYLSYPDSKKSPEPQAPKQPHHVKSKSMIHKNQEVGMYTRILKQFSQKQDQKQYTFGKLDTQKRQPADYRKELEMKKFPSAVETDLNAYIEKYKQRVAKAAAKAATYKVGGAGAGAGPGAGAGVNPTTAHHLPTSVLTTGGPSKKGHHKRSVSDGIVLSQAFQSGKKSAAVDEQTAKTMLQKQQQQAFSKPKHKKNTTSSFAGGAHYHGSKVQSPIRGAAKPGGYLNSSQNFTESSAIGSSKYEVPYSDGRSYFNTEASSGHNHGYFHQLDIRPKADGIMAPRITEEDEVRPHDFQEDVGYMRKGAIVLKSGGLPVKELKSARVEQNQHHIGQQDFSFERQLFARKNQRELHSYPITTLQSYEKIERPMEIADNLFAGEVGEKEFIIDEADFGQSVLSPHHGDDGVVDTQSSGICKESHNHPAGGEQFSVKRKSSGEKYMNALKKPGSSHKRYKSDIYEAKRAEIGKKSQHGIIYEGQSSDRVTAANLKGPIRKTHHYSQSITGAPGSFTPNLLKKPETSMGGGMATAISKYKKFMLTTSHGDSSSRKESPRFRDGPTQQQPSGKLRPYFPGKSPEIVTPSSENSTPSLQLRPSQKPVGISLHGVEAPRAKGGAFSYFKDTSRDVTPKSAVAANQKTPQLYKKDKVADSTAKKQKDHLHKTMEKPRPKQSSSSVNMDPLPSQMTLSEFAGANLTPRTTARLKLMKLVRLSFATYEHPPKTTSDFYRVGKILGKGAFGKVNLAIHKLSQKMVALKSINKNYLSEEKQMKKKVMHEVNIIKLLRHPNIVKLFENFETNKHIVFVMELCPGGDLLNYVRKRRRLKENFGKFVFRQILEALSHCHAKSILHRDIKLDNVLLDSRGNVKLCDFGVSKHVKKGERMTQQCGTPAYIAPEILQDQGYEGFAVDAWSAGVVLFAMLYGTVPFKANNMSDLHKLIIKAKYTLKDDISKDAQDLITRLLEPLPKKRMTIAEALKHPWFKDTPAQIEMFTEQETNFIKTEYTYNDARRLNRNNKQTSTSETDPFTEHNLDSINTGLDKNNTEKSVILAPFNSTRSDCGALEQVKDKVVIKGRIKFAARCRELDRQYEANNNADLDNGVYNKLANESRTALGNEEEKTARDLPAGKKKAKDGSDGLKQEDSLVSSFNEAEKASEAELERLESMALENKKRIKTPEALSLSDRKHLMDSEEALVIDEMYVAEVESWGFPRQYIFHSLQNNEVNHATTSYYLLAWSANQPIFAQS